MFEKDLWVSRRQPCWLLDRRTTPDRQAQGRARRPFRRISQTDRL